MTTATIRAIDRAAAALGGVSDYRLAKILGIGQQALSKYRVGERQLDDAVAVKVAEIIGADPAALLAEIQAERTKDEGARAHWLRLAALARAACLVLAFAVAILAGTQMSVDDGIPAYGPATYAAGSAACAGQKTLQCVQRRQEWPSTDSA